jgi:hypothetical protein
VGDTEADHVEQLAIVRGAEVSRLGPTATMIRNPSVVGDTVVFESQPRELPRSVRGDRRGAVRRLTDDAAGNFEPALSPDGRRWRSRRRATATPSCTCSRWPAARRPA